jgi:hypothetical protein
MEKKINLIKGVLSFFKSEPSIEGIGENFRKITGKGISLSINKIKEKI